MFTIKKEYFHLIFALKKNNGKNYRNCVMKIEGSNCFSGEPDHNKNFMNV